MDLDFEYSIDRDDCKTDVVITGDHVGQPQTVLLKFISPRTIYTEEFSLNELAELREIITDVLRETDSQRVCPACQISQEMRHQHENCWAFPFFEVERATQPETKAVRR